MRFVEASASLSIGKLAIAQLHDQSDYNPRMLALALTSAASARGRRTRPTNPWRRPDNGMGKLSPASHTTLAKSLSPTTTDPTTRTLSACWKSWPDTTYSNFFSHRTLCPATSRYRPRNRPGRPRRRQSHLHPSASDLQKRIRNQTGTRPANPPCKMPSATTPISSARPSADAAPPCSASPANSASNQSCGTLPATTGTPRQPRLSSAKSQADSRRRRDPSPRWRAQADGRRPLPNRHRHRSSDCTLQKGRI